MAKVKVEKKKQQYWWYVLVFTDNGPMYVTKVDWDTKSWWASAFEKPLAMSESRADDVYTGVCLNFSTAALVRHKFELESQPYRYKNWKIEFVPREKEDDDDDDYEDEDNAN